MSEPIENPIALKDGWAALAFTKKQWDLINVALIKAQGPVLNEIFGVDNFNYVYKWTKNVGSQP